MYKTLILPIEGVWHAPLYSRSIYPGVLEHAKQHLAYRIIEKILGRDAEVSEDVADKLVSMIQITNHSYHEQHFQLELVMPQVPPEGVQRAVRLYDNDETWIHHPRSFVVSHYPGTRVKCELIGLEIPTNTWIYK